MKPTQKKGDTDQQTESLQLSENRKLTQKKGGNGPKKTENKSNVNIAETNPKYPSTLCGNLGPQQTCIFKSLFR